MSEPKETPRPTPEELFAAARIELKRLAAFDGFEVDESVGSAWNEQQDLGLIVLRGTRLDSRGQSRAVSVPVVIKRDGERLVIEDVRPSEFAIQRQLDKSYHAKSDAWVEKAVGSKGA